MPITERQENILDRIVQEYIHSVQPVSSQLLERKFDFVISPATLRIEMQKLTDKGYLLQPHTSAGRVPTDKGYRFFVDNLLKEKFPDSKAELFFEEIDQIEKEIKNSFQFARALTKRVAELTSNLAMSYLPDEEVVLKEGWGEIFKEPEFEDPNCLLRFTKMVEEWEKNIGEIFRDSSDFQIYIGRENPLSKAKDFTLILSKCHFPKEEGILTIIGPKRMAYPKNISLIKSLTKFVNEFE